MPSIKAKAIIDFLLLYFKLDLFVSVCLSVCHFKLQDRFRTQPYWGAFYPYLTTSLVGFTCLICELRKHCKSHRKPTRLLHKPHNNNMKMQLPSLNHCKLLTLSVLFPQLLKRCVVHSVIKVVHTGNVQILKCNRYIVKYYRCILHICMSNRHFIWTH